MNYLIGVLEDNFQLIYFGKFLRLYGTAFVQDISSPFPLNFSISKGTEYPFFLLYFRLAKSINSITLYNFFTLISLCLVLFFSFQVLRMFIENKYISLFLACLYMISPYFMFQSRSHPTLLFVWVILAAAPLFIKPISKRTVLVGAIASLLIMCSNYLAFFLVVFYSVYTLCYVFLSLINSRCIDTEIKKRCLFYILNILIFVVSTLLYFSPLLLSTNQSFTKSVDIYPHRTIEDFFLLTSRPWYFVLPSAENPFYGGITTSVLGKLQSTNYYLFNNYFVSEHSASFLGCINLMMACIGLFVVYTKRYLQEHRLVLLSLFLTFIFISILMMPPFFTLAGVKIYLPSYIIFHSLQMFRGLVRLGILNLIIVLVFAGIGYEYVLQKYKESKRYSFLKIGLFSLVFMSITEFWTPLNFTYLGSAHVPEVFSYLATQKATGSVIAYPFSYANSTLIWHEVHKKPILNSKYATVGFDPRKFTNELATEKQLIAAKKLGARYIIVFDDTHIDFFNASPLLIKMQEFEESSPPYSKDNWIYKINYPGPFEKATLYMLKD